MTNSARNDANEKNEWLLLVEDDTSLARAMAQSFEKEGFRCIISGKVSDALMRVKNQKFICIFLDMKLEQGSGERILEFVRMDKRNINFATPIIVISGYLDPELVKRVAPTTSDVLVKPFDTKTLMERFRRAVKGGESAEASEIEKAAGDLLRRPG